MKRLIPSSLLPRVFAVTLAALLALVGLLWLVLQGGPSTTFFSQGLKSAGPSIAELVRALDAGDADASRPIAIFNTSLRAARVDASFPAQAEADPILQTALADAAPRLFAGRALRFRVGRPIGTPADPRPLKAGIAEIVLEVDIALQDARVLRVAFAPPALIANQPRGALLLVMASVLIVGSVAAIALRGLLASLAQLEQAADELGMRLAPTHIHERGPREVRSLARTLNAMQDRIAGLVSDRTRTFSALAHDLRTGMTRLRLRIEGGRPEMLEAALHDIDEMNALVEDMLLYARSGHASDRDELVDVHAIARLWASERELTFANDAHRPYWIVGNPLALRRVLDNLLENARRYAGDAEFVALSGVDGLDLCILDRGPGIEAEDVDRVFEPFERGEGSRNRETGGSGLGLGIARELMRAIGGDVLLLQRPGGGLEARVRFPESLRVD